ncbi:MAG: hypothetical protein JKY65_29770 [Planctomycetes bacterium]|nr:hypothetical protein [Planctomycetota bacterium]
MRDDLPLGVLAAQLVHAAGESAPGDLLAGTRAVVLAVSDEGGLLRVAERLEERRISHVCIREPDAPWHGQAMAIGLAPLWNRRPARRVLGRLRLLNSEVDDE